MQIVVNMLLSRIKKHNPGLNEAQLLSRRFGLEVLVNEASKFLIYLLVFTLFSLTWYFLLSMLVYCTIRVISGGYHAGSYWGCLVVSFAVFAFPVVCGQLVQPVMYVKAALLLTTLVITLALAPINHKNTPKRNLSKAGKFKILSIILVAFWSIVAWVLPDKWSTTAVLTIFTEGIMQIFGKLFNPVVNNSESEVQVR